jgi:hypothetical protein
MTNEPWYEIVEANMPLTQGDLIFDCPLLTWKSPPQGSPAGVENAPSLQDLAAACREDVVVMTQA